jgi:hypothetical protein
MVLAVSTWSLSGINLNDPSIQRLQWAPQEMIDRRASALMEQNNALTLPRKRDTGQLEKRHFAVER